MVWEWSNLYGCTGAMLGVADIGTDTGVTLGTVGVCGFGACGVTVVTSEVVSVGLTLHSQRCCLVQW